jgi:hypothetical protein
MRMTLTPDPKLYKFAEKLRTKKDMADLGLMAIKNIRNRTQLKGVDYKGRAFKKYSPKYSEKTGKKFVNLTGTKAGKRMLNLIKVKATKNEALIYFSDAMKEIIANNHNNGVRVPKREFFGIGKDDEKIVNKEYRKLLDKKIRAWENAK